MLFNENWHTLFSTVKKKIRENLPLREKERRHVLYWRVEYPELVQEECREMLSSWK